MEPTRYLLITTVCLSLCYTAYRLIFSKETHFRILRIYLLGSVFLSLLLPFITLEIHTGLSFVETPSPQVNLIYAPAIEQSSEVVARPHAGFQGFEPFKAFLNRQDFFEVLAYLYMLVTSFLLIRLIAQVVLLIIAYAQSEKVPRDKYTLLFNHRFRHTFSFFRWIFIDNESASSGELNQIIAHENTHVSQYHSIDIVLMELLTAMMWFNPLVWKMKQEMQLVHEYLADEGVLNTGVDRLSYQALLVNQVAGERLISLSSSFNYSLIKKRITMMTTRKINRNAKAKLLTFIPLSAALLSIIAVTNGAFAVNVTTNLIGKQPTPDRSLEMVMAQPISITTGDTIKKKTIVKMVHSKNPNDTIVEETEEIIVTNDSLGKKYVTIVEPGSKVHHYEALPDAKKNVYQKTVIINANEKADQSTVETKTELDAFFESKGTVKDTVYVSSIEKKYKTTNDNSGSEVKTIVIKKSGKHNPNILYIIDGVEKSNKNALLDMNPDEIHSIEVIKDDHAKKYTEKEVDGVIIITTKSGKK